MAAQTRGVVTPSSGFGIISGEPEAIRISRSTSRLPITDPPRLPRNPLLESFRFADRLFWGVVAAPKSYRAGAGIDLCSDFNEVAFRVAHHRFVVSVSSYPRTSSYGHSGCAHGSY
jgi:hypothetical protein